MSRGWRVGSATRRLVFQQKGLLLYPLVSGAIGMGEVLSLFAAVYLFSGLSVYASIAALVVYYPVVTFTSTYLLMAMLVAFRSFAGGERVGMRQALAEVRPYSKVILEWAVFVSLIMLAVRVVQAPLGRLGGAIFGLVTSVSISFATFFAIPVILDRRTGPIQTIKESAAFLARNFGQSFGGVVFSDLYSLLLIVPGIALIPIGTGVAIAFHSLAGLLLLAVGAVLILFGGLLNYTMQNVLRLIIYEHSSGKPLPQGFPPEVYSQSIRLKKSRRSPANAATAAGISARYCSSCGRQVGAGWTFCGSCGAPIS